MTSDLDYTSINSLSLNGGTIVDSSLDAIDYPAILTLPLPGTSLSLSGNKNIIIDGTIPELFIASANGTTLNLLYSIGYSELLNTDLLDEESIPSPSTFSVLVNGSPVSVSTVSISDSDHTVTLTLATPIIHDQTVTISYVVPGLNPLQDTA